MKTKSTGFYLHAHNSPCVFLRIPHFSLPPLTPRLILLRIIWGKWLRLTRKEYSLSLAPPPTPAFLFYFGIIAPMFVIILCLQFVIYLIILPCTFTYYIVWLLDFIIYTFPFPFWGSNWGYYKNHAWLIELLTSFFYGV